MISLIMTTYNGGSVLADQLSAIQSQQYDGAWELIIADNGSTDNTLAVARSYLPTLPNLRIIDASQRSGSPYANNAAVKAARGTQLVFCEQDDVVAAGWLVAMAAALERYEVVIGGIEVERLNAHSPWRRPAPPNGAATPVLGFLPYGMTCNLGVARQAFEAIGGFTEDAYVCQDIDLCWRLQLHGYALTDAPDAIVHYRYRDSLWGLWKQTVAYAEAHVYLYRRFAPYGMPRSALSQAARKYRQLLTRFPAAVRGDQEQRVFWIRTAATCWGHLRASLRHQALYL